MRIVVAALFAALVLAACIFVMRVALVRIRWLTRYRPNVRRLTVTVATGSLAMVGLTVFGSCVLEAIVGAPDWRAIFGWNCLNFLIFVSALSVTAFYQVKKGEIQ